MTPVPALSDGRIRLSRTGWAMMGGIAAIWAGLFGLAFLSGPDGLTGSFQAVIPWFAGGALSLCLAALAVCDARYHRMRRTAELLGQILENAPFPVQVKDADLRYLWLNKSHTAERAATAGTAANVVGKTVAEVGLDPVLAEHVMAHDREVLAAGVPGEPREQVIFGPDGQVREIYLVSKVPLRTDGRVTHLATMSADTISWRDAQVRNEEARLLLETVLEAAPITIQVIDRDMRFQWVNRAYRDLFDIGNGPLIGVSIEDVPRSRHFAAATRDVNEMIFATGRGPVEVEQYMPASATKPEVHLLVTKVPIRDRTGAVTRILTMGTDVTALKQAQARAEAADSLIGGILRHAPLGIQVKDADLRIRWANATFAAAVGGDPDDVLGKTLEELGLPAGPVERTNEMDRKVLSEGSRVEFDERWAEEGGVYRFIRTIKAPLLDAHGKPTHVITLGTDISEAIRLRAEAEEARRQLQLVLDSVPVTMALKDRDDRYVWVNGEFQRLFREFYGLDALDLIGQKAGEAEPPSDVTQAVPALDQAVFLTGREAAPMVQEFHRPDGSTASLLVRRIPVFAADGGVNGVLTIGVDVTEQLRTTAELRDLTQKLERRVAERTSELAEANKLISTVIESAPVPTVVYRLDGTIRIWNPAAARVTGYPFEEAREALAIHQPPGNQTALLARLADAAKGVPLPVLDMNVRRKDGTVVEVLVSSAPLIGADGVIDGMVSSWLDVSDQRRAEEHMRRWFEVFEKAEVGLAIADAGPPYSQRMANAALLRMLRTTPEELARLGRDHYYAAKEKARVAAAIEQADRLGYISFEATLRRSDGSEFEALISVTSIPADQTLPRRRISTIIDITRQRQIEEQFRQAQKMEAVGQLTGGIAHDFNNLLTTILGNSELLELQGSDLGDRARASIRRIRQAGERAALLTRQMLAFSRKQSLRPEVVDVNQLITGMSEILRRTPGGHIETVFQLAGGLWPVLIDANQLESALLNLAINGRDAMPSGGILCIQTSNSPLDEAFATEIGATAGPYVTIAVRDTGIGMTEDEIHHAFEPFFTTKPIGKGTGLGLSQVYGFVKQSGGQVILVSEIGRGTTATIYLPAHHPSGAEAGGTAASGETKAPPAAGETVLVVEDEDAVREYSREALVSLGYNVLTAADADTALTILDTTPGIALLFSDLGLPGMNGQALTDEASRRHPGLKVLLTTGYAGDDLAGSGAVDGGPKPLPKPFTIAALAERVRRALDAP